MFKINALLAISLLLFSIQAYACDCSSSFFTKNFETSTFVAKVKLLEIRPDVNDEDYHEADIQILELYKGKRLTTINIHSQLNSSCGFMPKANSTWIVFAAEFEGKLSFQYCSSSIDLTRTFNEKESPDVARNYRNSTKMKAQVLKLLYKQKIEKLSSDAFYVAPEGLETIKGYKNNNRFAIFEVEVGPNLSISKVNTIKRFQNRNLHQAVLKSVQHSTLGSYTLDSPKVSTPTPVILVIYYYDQEQSYQSFVSMASL